MKKTVLVFGFLIFTFFSHSIFSLTTGDIYFVGWNADGNDDIVFLTFVDINTGTKIYFRDDEYNIGWVDENEGCFSWTCPAGGINAGDVIQIYDCTEAPPTASQGTCIKEDGFFNISGSEDAVYAYLSTSSWNSGTFTFLAAFCHQINFGSNLLNGTGLTDNINAWSWDSNKDNWRYFGSRSGASVAAVKALIQNSDNWEYLTGTGDQSFTFNLTDFTLPVTLSSFTAQYLNDTPTLCWTTQSETNNAGWNIYRGETNEALSNEEAYQLNLSLGLIPGAGTTSELTDYSFEDIFPVYQQTTYFYWLESVDYSGETGSYGPITLLIPEDENEPGSPEIPGIYGLHQNYPNPFNPSTEISFIMKENCIAELSVYNIKGEKIATLFQNKSVAKDELIRTNWDGKDDFGKTVSSGIYLYKLRTNKEDFVRRMILMK